jgi:DNA-directed RNA polymerase subunit RPC12/RpoP
LSAVVLVLEMSEKIWIRCPRPECGYEWETKSRMRTVTCSSCGHKVPNPIYKKPQETLMEHFNLDEHGVKILDHSLISQNSPRGRIVDVRFKPNKAWCEYCDSEKCRHVEFALLLPMVQEILKKKGWKIA